MEDTPLRKERSISKSATGLRRGREEVDEVESPRVLV